MYKAKQTFKVSNRGYNRAIAILHGIYIQNIKHIKFTERLDYYILVIIDQSLLTGPLLRICQGRGHQEKGTQLGGGKREKWELVWPRKILYF
jgi:hypothetical protein